MNTVSLYTTKTVLGVLIYREHMNGLFMCFYVKVPKIVR